MEQSYQPDHPNLAVPLPPTPPAVVFSGHPSPTPSPRPIASFIPPFLVPTTFMINPARIDGRRTQELLQFMENEGLVPSPEEEAKRRDVIMQLKRVVGEWIREVAWLRNIPVQRTSAAILTFGSYGLGVHGPDSDIDAICFGPCYATMEEDFFISLYNMLQNRPEVSKICCVKSAKVPLMRFKFNGISIDFTYARLLALAFPYGQVEALSIPNDVECFNPSSLIMDETSWRSLSGFRVNARILQLVPNLKNYQAMLRCIKLWARRRGLYSHLLGFYGGIHLAILAAHVCQRCPNASISGLVSFFFEIFTHWRWPEPVILLDRSIPFRLPGRRYFMPIMMPCSPFEWCNSNITRSTFVKIREEIHRGYALTRELGRPDFDWNFLFESFPYAKVYAFFLRIFLAATDGDELLDWLGWVKSRMRGLLLKLEAAYGFCDPNPTEYVDHNVTEPNTVFYWGLPHGSSSFNDLDSIKEDFVKSVRNDEIYANEKSSVCTLELSIISSSQLPKSMQPDTVCVMESKSCWRLDQNQFRRPINYHYVR